MSRIKRRGARKGASRRATAEEATRFFSRSRPAREHAATAARAAIATDRARGARQCARALRGGPRPLFFFRPRPGGGEGRIAASRTRAARYRGRTRERPGLTEARRGAPRRPPPVGRRAATAEGWGSARALPKPGLWDCFSSPPPAAAAAGVPAAGVTSGRGRGGGPLRDGSPGFGAVDAQQLC